MESQAVATQVALSSPTGALWALFLLNPKKQQKSEDKSASQSRRRLPRRSAQCVDENEALETAWPLVHKILVSEKTSL